MTNMNKIFTSGLKAVIFLSLIIVLFYNNSALAVNQPKSILVSEAPSQVTLLDNKTEAVTLKFEVGRVNFVPVVTAEGEFVLPSISGFSRSFKAGEPSFPIANKIISIPFDCELQIEILSSEYVTYDLNDLGLKNPIMPVQPPLSKSEDASDLKFVYDRVLYQTNQPYQLPVIDAKILGTLRSEHLALVSFSPFIYNPVENSLSVCKSLTVSINYINPDWNKTAFMRQNYYSPLFEPSYQTIINYTSSSLAVRSGIINYPVKYLIISDRMFEAQLQPFIEWKIKKGFNVVVAYTDVIGSTSEAIKDYIRILYNAGTAEDPAPSFVLLVGDDEQVPAFNGDHGNFVTDLHFCEFTGDYFPEIYYGRFSAQTTAQLQPQIDKTLEYEQYLMPDPSYLADVTLVAGYDVSSSDTFGNGQINYGSQNYFNAAHNINSHIWLHPASSEPGAKEAIINTINDGVGFFNYTAHCTHEGHSNPEFGLDDANSLTNINKYLLGIGNCCQSNTFGSNFGSPCLGEVFLRAENSGGIGYIGASEDTYWDEDYWWAVGYGPVDGSGPDFAETGPGAFDGVFHDHGEPVSEHFNTNSAIIMAGNLAVTESGSSRGEYYWEVYHLMGDPSVMTYFGLPTANTVAHPVSVDRHGSSVVITALPGSYVGISANGNLHGAGYIDASGSVTIDLTPFPTTGVADVVVTAQNKIPYFGSMGVLENSNPHVIIETITIYDTSVGNGNGLIEAGESLTLGVELNNVGIAEAVDVTATLTTADAYVTITDNSESYGTMAGSYTVKNISNAFSLFFDANTPDEYTAAFELSVVDGSRADPPWISEFTLTAHRPLATVLAVTIDDSAENGNEIPEPGETIEIVVTLKNNGTGTGNVIIGSLSGNDSYISLIGSSGYFGNLPVSGECDNGAVPFIISIDAACPPGYEKNFILEISGDFGFYQSLDFDLIVGGRVPIYNDDFSTDKGWSGLGIGPGTAEWTIGPATGGNGSDTYGSADPEFDNSDTEDNGVLGNDLNPGTSGDYGPNLGSTEWVVSPVIDCSYFDGIELYFSRYLGIEGNSNDYALLDVYNGTGWVRIFESSTTIDESSWSEQFYDLSLYADNNPDFQIRFGLGATNSYGNYCGWNIDDLRLIGYDQSGSCGDVNHDGNIDILDIVAIIVYKYKGGAAPDPLFNADVDGTNSVDILDIIYLINYRYKGGPYPACP